MNHVRWHGALAILFSPPFGFILGLIAAIVLWFTLADAGLPDWARVVISLMAVTAVPGLWFLILPLWLVTSQVTRIDEPSGHREWAQEQSRAWETHGDQLSALVAAPIRSIQAIGTSQESDTARVRLLALDLSDGGGCISVQYRLKVERQPMDEPPTDLSAIIGDDLGTTYAVTTRCLDTAADGGRCSIYFLPAPPTDAHDLQLTIDRLYVFGQQATIDGPWRFSVPLSANAL